MVGLDYTPQSNLLWGLETAEGSKVASEVACERGHAAAGTSQLLTKPEVQPASGKHVSKIEPCRFCFYGAELPPNAALLARTLDVPTLRLQGELLRVRNATALQVEGTCLLVMSCEILPLLCACFQGLAVMVRCTHDLSRLH